MHVQYLSISIEYLCKDMMFFIYSFSRWDIKSPSKSLLAGRTADSTAPRWREQDLGRFARNWLNKKRLARTNIYTYMWHNKKRYTYTYIYI